MVVKSPSGGVLRTQREVEIISGLRIKVVMIHSWIFPTFICNAVYKILPGVLPVYPPSSAISTFCSRVMIILLLYIL